MSLEEDIPVPGSNSWAKKGSADRTKVEVLPYLRPWLMGESIVDKSPTARKILELASGFGDHVSYFSDNVPSVTFQPTEAQDVCIEAIREATKNARNKNVLPALKLNVLSQANWDNMIKTTGEIDGIFLLNMLHISPWGCTEALFRNAAQILKGRAGAFVAVYGAFKVNGEFVSENDNLFDIDLKGRDKRWGIRDLDSEVNAEARKNGFTLKECHKLNFNNLFLIWSLE
ncbi:hypothetical protein V1511DRAFT_321020 [Dipodascopsis uninucleata]